jgi:hypothetical protein
MVSGEQAQALMASLAASGAAAPVALHSGAGAAAAKAGLTHCLAVTTGVAGAVRPGPLKMQPQPQQRFRSAFSAQAFVCAVDLHTGEQFQCQCSPGAAGTGYSTGQGSGGEGEGKGGATPTAHFGFLDGLVLRKVRDSAGEDEGAAPADGHWLTTSTAAVLACDCREEGKEEEEEEGQTGGGAGAEPDLYVVGEDDVDLE